MRRLSAMELDATAPGRPPGFGVSDDLLPVAPKAQASRHGRRQPIAAATLCAGDALTWLAAWAALVPLGASDGPMPRVLILIAAVLSALFWSNGLYPGYRLHGFELLRRRIELTLRVGALACLGALVLAETWRPPLLIAAFLGLALAVQPPMRSVLRGLLWRAGLWGESTAILGEPAQVRALGDYFARHWQYGVRPQTAAETAAEPEATALIAGPAPSRDEIARLRRTHPDVFLLADLPGLAISGLRPSEIGGEIGLRLGGAGPRPAQNQALGRAFDIAFAALAVVAAAPFLAFSVAAIWIVDPGPVFYTQNREGLKGRPFKILKLRTMYRDADARLAALLAADPQARADWERHFKLRHDPRVLPWVGGFLRGASIDELPQLANVLMGDMRLVGPRPFPAYHLAAMDRATRLRRSSVTPGLTGLWQISGRGDADLDRARQLDEFYLENRSFWLDLHILLKTAPAVLRGDGAY